VWFAWAGAVTAALVVAALMSRPAPPRRTAPALAEDPDHELLVGVERSLRRNVPRALAPATLITQELSSAAEKKKNP
jgi:hypothetical protein